MSKKRLSLAEVMSEDEQRAAKVVAEPVPVPVDSSPTMRVVATPAPAPAAPTLAPTAAPAVQASAPEAVEVVMEKLTVTMPQDMHEQLLDIARARRRAKQPYQLSQIVREAMAAWFATNANDAS